MCAALYHPVTVALAAWGEFKFPYGRTVRAQYQGNREYLGHLFSLIVLIAHTAAHTTTREYMWINDNVGAIQWAAAQKCSSMASHYTNLAVTQLHMTTRLRMVPSVHKPGIEMGDIDKMSRHVPLGTMTRALVAGTITYLTASLNTVSYLYRHSTSASPPRKSDGSRLPPKSVQTRVCK